MEPFTILQGRYLLGMVLGEGGFGITYIALDLQTGRRVAIKELFVAGLLKRENTRTVLVDSSMNGRAFYNECKAKFIQEAMLLQKLSDKKGVVDIYEFFEENATAYIVMEYLEGVDLSAYLKGKGGKIPFKEAFLFLRPVMKSLIEMHAVGVYHRDVSPDNIRYLSKTHRMKIMDLGGAKYLHREGTGLEHVVSHLVLVKHGYAPPEQYVTGYKIGPWMDVYAMGATLYRCITGIVPQESTSRVGHDELIPPRKLGIEISQQAENVIMKAMALTPEERYIDMREFYKELKNASGEIVSEAVPPRTDKEYEEILKELEENDKSKTIVNIVLMTVVGLLIILLLRLGIGI